jgi:hypothetical protein
VLPPWVSAQPLWMANAEVGARANIDMASEANTDSLRVVAHSIRLAVGSFDEMAPSGTIPVLQGILLGALVYTYRFLPGLSLSGGHFFGAAWVSVVAPSPP